MRDILSCAWKSLARKRLRTLLTAGSITIGVSMVAVVSLIGSAGKTAVNGELESLGISGLSISTNASLSEDGLSGLSEEDLALIRSTGNVETAMPLMIEYSTSTLREVQSGTLICGIDAGAKQAISLSLKHGRLISKADVQSAAMICVVDETLAREAYGRDNITGKTIRLQIGGTQEELEIVGIAEAGSTLLQSLGEFIPGMVYVPYSTLQALTGRSTFDQVAVRVSDSADIEATETLLLSRLERATGTQGYFRTDNLATQRDRLGNLLDIVSLVLTVISGISLVVSGLGIMTIMLVSVSERTREIGVKKAIGASRSRILWEFLAEAVTISLLGSLAGIAVGGGAGWLGIRAFGLEVPIDGAAFGFLILFSVLLGGVFGVYPALKAARLKPVDALRQE
ncbi:MAG TPA: ABC transporter permease [Firmicutes bacterium]|nr:ABC transporter permease [Bacillota bacterium]